jgi:hypothetical protein
VRFFALLGVGILLLAVTLPLSAGGYYYPGTQRDGYTFRNGYWYRGNTPYYANAQTAYSYVPYYSYGQTYYYQQPYTYYTYEQAPAETYTPKASAPANWKSELLKLAGARDEQLGYLNALRALGLPQPLQAPAQGPYQAQAPGYAGVPYAMNAQTLYGYSYSTVKDVYGDTNLNTLYQQAARLAQNSQALAGQATGDFSSLVQQEGGNRSRVAEILAKAQAASAALRAAEAAPSAHVTTSASASVTGSSAGVDTTPEVQPSVSAGQQQGYSQAAPQQGYAGQAQQAFGALLQNRCTGCHGGSDPAGKLTLTPQSYAQMSLSDKARLIWPRLTHHDPQKRMPRSKDGKATTLTPEELRLFYMN